MTPGKLSGRLRRLEDRQKEGQPQGVRVTVTRSIVEAGEGGPQVCRTVRRTFQLYPDPAHRPGRRRAK